MDFQVLGRYATENYQTKLPEGSILLNWNTLWSTWLQEAKPDANLSKQI